jgi:branched-chain amino acid transport system substrate-binding protein
LGFNFINFTGKVSKEDTINIGAILILTGVGSNNGQEAQNGIELAISEINSKGGILGKQVVVTYEDNQGDDAIIGLNALHSLIFKGINIVIGPQWSSTGLAIAPVACQENVLLFSTSIGMKEFTASCDNIFSLWPVSEESSKEFALEIAKKDYNKIAIINSPQAWEEYQGEVIEKTLKSKGKITLLTKFGGTDFYTESLKIEQFNPDAIVFTNYGTEDKAAKALRSLGLSVPFYALSIDQSKIDAAQGAFENAISTSLFTPTKEFIEKYYKKYNKMPDVTSDTAYDIVYLLKEAIESTKSTDTQKLSRYLLNKKQYNGASGYFEFDGTGSIRKNLTYLRVKNGEIINIS